MESEAAKRPWGGRVIAVAQTTDASAWPCLQGTVSETELGRFADGGVAKQGGNGTGTIEGKHHFPRKINISV